MMSVSVVVTSHNRKYEARRALDSVYAQERIPDEIIFIDDASEDKTKEYIMECGFSGLKYIYNKKRFGPGISRNIGIRQATGDYIAFLDSDNLWYADKLKVFLKVITENSDLDVVFSRYKKHIKYRVEEYPKMLPEVRLEQYISTYGIVDASAAIYKRKFLMDVKGFTESMWTNIDFELLLRASKKKAIQIRMIDRCLSENDYMYDGLETNLFAKYKDLIHLFSSYFLNIKGVGMHTKFYESFKLDLEQNELNMDQLLEYMLKEGALTKEFIYTMIDYGHDLNDKKYASAVRKAKFYALLSDWMELKWSGGSLADTLREHNIHCAAVYGAGKHGRFLYQDLMDRDFAVMYFIDRNKNAHAPEGLTVYLPEEDAPTVDAVLVSVYLEFEEVERSLKGCPDRKLISLDKLIKCALGKEEWEYV